MKTHKLILSCVLVLSSTTILQGQTAGTPYTVVQRGGNYQVWERTVKEYTASGGVVSQKQRYVQTATGLNHLVDGQWAASSQQIDLSADGRMAYATNGQHQVYFPGNLGNGFIELVTPAGKVLRSQPIGLGYSDGHKSVLLAELNGATGQLLPTGNQVRYPDAFKGLKADVLYTYTLAGFEQDIVLREQLPDPGSLGLNPATTRLQIFTEFFNPPQPRQHPGWRHGGGKNGNPDGLRDTTLDFGGMEMGPGQAFTVTNSLLLAVRGARRWRRGWPVYKRWLRVRGRTFLIEELPLAQLQGELQNLPQGGKQSKAEEGLGRKVKIGQVVPPRPSLAQVRTRFVQLARTAQPRSPGMVLDYDLINSSQTNFTFQGNLTYYISGPVDLYGATTIEGGTVIKFDNTNSSALNINGPLDCKTGPYRPAELTDKYDDTVGEAITTNGWTPVTQTNSYYLRLAGGTNYTVKDLRFSYANQGLWVDNQSAGADIWDCQFVSCYDGALISATNVLFHNALFGQCTNAVNVDNGQPLAGEQVTAAVGSLWNPNDTAPAEVDLTNSIIVGAVGSGPTFNTNEVVINPGGTIFESAGAGDYYLANNTYRDIGTTNISAAMLAELRQKTTYPPQLESWKWFAGDTTLGTLVPRDTNAADVDLGYHYDPLDYYFDGFNVLFYGILTFNNGVQVGFGGPFYLEPDTQFVSQGKADHLNRLVQCRTVQEEPQGLLWPGQQTAWQPTLSSDAQYNSVTVNCRFTEFSRMAGPGGHVSDDYKGGTWDFRDCQFRGSQVSFVGQSYTLNVGLTNCLFDRTEFNAGGSYLTLQAYNNLFNQGGIWLSSSSALNAFTFRNNFFYENALTNNIVDNTLTDDHNGYVTNYNTLGSGTGDVIVSNFTFQSSWLGDFYQPEDSPLIDMGNTNAGALGLYHYTVTTNQVKEDNSTVDIGYHYVATDAYGNPLDSNGDGIPDYLEDANGNGITDNGENPWAAVAPTIITQPASQITDAGNTAIFTVSVTGSPPLSYQWYFNTNTLIVGATNVSLVLTNVQTTNAGTYFVVITNLGGSIISSNAILTVNVPTSCTPVPAGLVSWWPGEGNANDVVGTNNGTPVSISYTNGEVGQAFQFDGSNSYIAVPPSASLTVSNLTFAGWIYPTDTNTARPIMEFGGPNVSVSVDFWINDAGLTTVPGGLFGDIRTPGNIDLPVTVPGGTVPLNQWSYVALTVDTATRTATIYYNGVPLGSATSGEAVDPQTSGQYLDLGYRDVNSPEVYAGRHFAGRLDEMSVYNRALSSNEIEAIYLAGYYGKCASNTNNPPVIIVQPTNQTVLAGASVMFNVAAEGVSPLSYQWRKNGSNLTDGGNVSGANSNTLTLTNLTPADAGIYDVVVTNTAGRVASLYAVLRVWSPADVVAWGDNGAGQCNVPSGLTNAVAIVGGGYHSLALRSDGTVVAWGDNSYGQTNVPSGLTNVVAIAAGYYHSLALGSDGTVVGWGCGTNIGEFPAYGQSIVPAGLSNVVAIAGGGYHSLALRNNGTLVAWGNNNMGQTNVPAGLSNVVAIAAGAYHNLALMGNGTVAAWGGDNFGQTNVPAGLSNVVAIAAGDYHSLALKSDGTVVAWGYNSYGQTNVPAGLSNVVAIAGGGYHSLALRSDGTVVAWGDDAYGQASVPSGLTNITAIAAGAYHSLVLGSNLPPIIVTQPQSQAVVAGSNVTFNVTAIGATPLSYQWYFNGTDLLNGATDASLTLTNVQATNAGNYAVLVTNSCGSTLSSNAVLTVAVPPVITIQPEPTNQAVIQGSNIIYSVTATGTSLTYQWRHDGADIAGANSNVFFRVATGPADSGDYSVVVANLAGSVTSSVVSVTVIVPPIITLQPTNQTVIQGSNANFGVSISTNSTLPLSYQWYFNATNLLPWATNALLTLTNVQTSDAGSYSVTVTNAAGSVTSSNALLIVGVPPSIATPPADQAVVQGADATFTVTASGTTPLSYQWRFNGTDIPGATGASYTRVDAQPGDAGNYSVAVANWAGSVTSTVASLTVNVPPLITAQPTNMTVIPGANVSFNVSATGTTPLSYQWQFDGTDIDGATNSSFTTNNVQLANAGTYSVVVTNVAGGVVSAGAVLSVVGISNIVVVGSSPQIQGSDSIAVGTQIALMATPFPSGVAFPDGYPIWSVTPGSGAAFTNGFAVGSITNAAVGQYAISASCGTASANFTLNVAGMGDSNYDGVPDALEVSYGTNTPQVQLGSWLFDTPDWSGLQGQLPISRTNLLLVAGFSLGAVEVNSNNGPAWLIYHETDTNTAFANINCRSGTVRFQFKPDWSSSNDGGVGPGCEGRLISMGGKGGTNGCWGLYLNPAGTGLAFCTETNSTTANAMTLQTNLTAAIQWSSSSWYEIVLTYCQTNSSLYINGSPVMTNGAGVTKWPGEIVRSQGFHIGSGNGGTNWAQGRFDNLETFNYALGAGAVAYHYNHHSPPTDLTNTCALAPIALNFQFVQTLTNGQYFYITNGSSTGNFGWLNWNNQLSLSAELNDFDLVTNFVDAQNSTSTVLHVGSWIYGITGTKSGQVTSTLDDLITNGIMFGVVQWDGYSQNTGNNFEFEAAGYINVQLVNYDPSGIKWLEFQYDGIRSCDSFVANPPWVEIISPTNDQVFDAPGPDLPGTIPITALANSDSHTTISNVAFYGGTDNLTITNFLGSVTTSWGITNQTNGIYPLTWTNAPQGTDFITAVATDELNSSTTSAPVVITVINPDPTIQITSPIDQTFPAHTRIPVQATASTPSGTISWVQLFAQTNGGTAYPLGYATFTNNYYQVIWPPAFGGTYILTAEVMDSRGSNAWSAPVTNYIRSLPAVAIINPTNNQTFLVSPTNITIQATAIPDPSTIITNVTFYQGTNYQPADIIGFTTTGSGDVYGITWDGITNGNYILSAEAFDTNGDVSFSLPVAMRVQPNQPPSVYAGPDITTNLSANPVQLVGLVSDDGLPYGTLSVNWTNISGPTNVVLTSTNQSATSVYFSATGVYQFVLSASDGQYTTYSTNTVTVIPANLAPVVSAGTNQTIILAARYSLTNDVVNSTTSEDPKSSQGKEFWLGFSQNYTYAAQLSLIISSETNTVVSIMVPGIDFFTNCTVTAGVVTTVVLPSSVEDDTDDQIDAKGIHVIARDDISVYGLSQEYATTDGYLGLPVKTLGTNYVVLGWMPSAGASEFLIVGTAKNTTVTITPTADDIQHGRFNGVPYSIHLDEGQVYQLQSLSGDLSGTTISADKPVAVFGGSQCAFVPKNYPYCDHVVEQIPPATTWGREFFTAPLWRTIPGDIFQIVAATNDTEIYTNGILATTLNENGIFTFLLTQPCKITANNPILLAQYAVSSTYPDGTDGQYGPGLNEPGDPFMMLIPPFEQFLTAYTVSTPFITNDYDTEGNLLQWTNYANIVVTNSGVGSINLDGTLINSSSFSAIGNSGFSYAQVPMVPGSHHFASSAPFGVFMYGLAWNDESYGYPGGFSLGAVADVAAVSLSPKAATNEVATTYCLTAVVTNQNNQPLAGVRVDFQITGSNSLSGSVYTDGSGRARFCYTGTNMGIDTITASVGTNSDTATNTWSYPYFRLQGSVWDDGLPVGQTNILWSQIGGPPVVGIFTPQILDPLVQVTGPGFYSFQLTADDTVLTNSAQVGITVVRNQPPSVDAGTNLFTKSGSVFLNGSVTDDGLPNGTLTTTWSRVSGPGTVTFGNADQAATTATFSTPGVYVLRLTGDDSQAAVYADVTVSVLVNPQPVGCGQTINGSLVSTDLHSIELTNSYANYYQFVGQSNHFVVVTMTSTNFDTYLIIRNQQLQILAEDDDSFDNTLGSTNSRITYCLPADGVYIIEATSALGAQTGNYTLQFQCGLPPNVVITSPHDGAVYPDAPANISVQVSAHFDNGIYSVDLYTNGNILTNLYTDYNASSSNVSIPYDWSGVSAGDYTLTAVAAGFGSDWFFDSITSAPVAISIGSPSIQLSPLAICPDLLLNPDTTTATLEDANGNPITGNVTFTVTGANPTNATIATSGSGVASFTYTGTNAGRDLVTATAAVGNWLLSAVVERDWAQPVSCDQVWSGTLTTNSPANTSPALLWGGYADYYSFSGQSNDTVVITMSSGNFDTYLNLWDANCDLVTSNDDYSGTDSQITYKLPADGTYTIEATSFLPYQTGSYTMQFACNPVLHTGTPKIAVLSGSQVLSNYATVNFGATTVSNPISLSFTITNEGTASLALGSPVTAGDFTVSNWPATLISTNSSASFTVQFDASTNENLLGQLGFANNDSAESPFILNLSAVANPPGASAPTVTLTAPTNFSVFPFGTNIVVSADASAADGYSITNVEFVAATGTSQFLIGVSTNSPYVINWVNANPGSYALFAVATDSAGRVGYSAPPVNVQILPPNNNHPPVATDLYTQVSAGSVNNVLDPLANDYDPDGNPLTIVALGTNQLSGAKVSIIDGGTKLSYTPPPGDPADVDWFGYEISDGQGGYASATVGIQIVPPGAPQVQIVSPVYPPNTYTTNAGAIVPITAKVYPWQAVTKVDFYLSESKIGEVTNGVDGYYTLTNWIATFSACGCGINAQAVDAFGQVGSSQPIYINVTNADIRGNSPNLVAELDSIGDANSTNTITDMMVIRDGLFNVYGKAFYTIPGTNVSWQLGLYNITDGSPVKVLTPPPLDSNAGCTTPIGSSTQSGILVSNCDFSTVPNGIYDLVLGVSGGLVHKDVTFRVRVESNLKLGQFSFSQQDLVIPVNGIPLTVTRTYNSFNPDKGDFGYGWRYSLGDMDVQIDETREMDLGWVAGTLSTKWFSQRTGGGRDVTLTLPDGQRTTFLYSPVGTYNITPAWKTAPGLPAGITLTAQYDPIYEGFYGQWVDHSPNSGDDLNVPDSAYDIPGFILTMPDGTVYKIDRQDLGAYEMDAGYNLHAYGKPYLAEIDEPSGDKITINSDGVAHYDAQNNLTRQIMFHRNSEGLIDYITDPIAQASGGPPADRYEYDSRDNLIDAERLVDRTANGGQGAYLTNTFVYGNPNFPHYITGIIDSDGVGVVRNLYDDSGRLIGVVDAEGNTNLFQYNISGQSETTYDRMGNPTTYVYDNRGNVTTEIDALGHVTQNTYDGDNNVTSTTVQLDSTTSYTTSYAYDGNGNRTQVVDPMDHTNSFSYDSTGNLLNQTNAVGDVTINQYDSSGNLTNTAQYGPNGNLVQQSSSAYVNGRLAETFNGNGQMTASFSYDANGNLINTTDAKGFSRSFGYDANGNQTNSTYVWTAPDGTQVTVANQTFYDAQGRVTMTIDANGNTNQTFYNPDGKVSYTIDKFGNTNSFTYDARGNLIQTVYPNGTFTRTVYNADGQPILTSDRNGSSGTLTLYDADGRVTNTIRATSVVINLEPDPNNPGLDTTTIGSEGVPISTNATAYYDNGWVKSRTTPDNQTTTYTYWPNGQTETVTDPLGHTTSYDYDNAGRQILISDAATHNTHFLYDAVGRQIATIYDNGTSVSNIFNNLGERVGTVDQAGLLTQYGYNATGQLTNVIKPQVVNTNGNLVAPAWSYTYDQYGRLTVTTDPNGHSTTNYYDALGRQLGQGLPMGQTNQWAVYNSKGQLWKHYDFKGQMVEHRYDQYGRTATNYYFAAGTTEPSYAVIYTYNQLDQLTNVTQLYGSDASSNYVALARNGSILETPMSAKLMASLNRYPNVSGGLTVLSLLALGMVFIPREKRRQLALATAEAWRTSVAQASRLRVQVASRRRYGHPQSAIRHPRLRMPSLFWRSASVLSMFALLASQPGFDQLWTAHADCVYPSNASTPTTRITSFSYDLDGHLAQVNSPEGVINYTYDLATGRLMDVCTANSEIQYGYDTLGRLQTVQVVKRDGVMLTTPEITTYHYDRVGNRSEVDLPNGVVTTYQYDDLNRLTNMVHQAGTTNLATYTYTLDKTGRRTNAVEVLLQEDGKYQTNNLTWQYDGMYRLTNEISVTTSPDGNYAYTNAYEYDPVGNRIHKIRTGDGAGTDDYVYNANDELASENDGGTAITYLYDANGSLTNKTSGSTVTGYTYNVANKLDGVYSDGTLAASYLYNYQGIRVQSIVNGVTTHYLIDNNNHTGYAQVLEEMQGTSTTPSMSYVIGDDVLAQCGATATDPSYFLPDGHGSNRQLSQMDGSVADHYTYDAYGTVQGSLSTSTAEDAVNNNVTSKLFCGEQYDASLHMYNLRARYYDPSNGRFNQRDSFAGNNDDPQTLHRYLYAGCDPVDGIDPSGNEFSLVGTISAITIGVTLASLAIPVIGVAYLSARGKVSFIQVLKYLSHLDTWATAASALFIGAAVGIAANSVILLAAKKIGLVAAKRLMAGIGLFFAIVGLVESVKMTWRLVTANIPPGNADRYVAVMLAGILLTVAVASAAKSGTLKNWFNNGAENDPAYWNLSSEDQAAYNRAQGFLPSDLINKLKGNTVDAIVARGNSLPDGGMASVWLRARGFWDVATNKSGNFNLWDWLMTGPTPSGRAVLGNNTALAGAVSILQLVDGGSE